MTCFFYSFGLIFLSTISYLIRDWTKLTLATSLPFALFFFYWFYFPESPRWLIAKNRFSEAAAILRRLAEVNGKEFPPGLTQQLKHKIYHENARKEELREKKKKIGLLSLFATPNMRLKTFLITLNWTTSQTVYVGLCYYGPALGNNEYLSFMLSSLVEIPSYIACWVVLDRWGRRWPLCICMMCCGVCCLITAFLTRGNIDISICMSNITF